MRPISFQQQLEKRLKDGAALVPLSKIETFKNISATTRNEWCRAGRLPVVKIQRRFYSLPDLIATAVSELTIPQKNQIESLPRSVADDLATIADFKKKKK